MVSQTLAAFLVVRCLVKTEASYGIRLRRLRIVKAKLIRILRIGIPTGVQGAVFSISNVLIQSAINSFDSSTIVGGNTASVNIENFVYTAMNAVYQGSLTFTSQNVGAHNVKRIVPIMWWSSLCVTAVGLLLGVTAVVFGRALLGIYSPDPQIIGLRLRQAQAHRPHLLPLRPDGHRLRLHTRARRLHNAHAHLPHRCLRAEDSLDIHHLRLDPLALHALPLLPRELARHLHSQPRLLRRHLPQVEVPRAGQHYHSQRLYSRIKYKYLLFAPPLF